MLSGYFHHKIYFLFGVGLTLFIACISMILSKFPYLSVMGPMILAIFIGIGINACFPVSQSLQTGIDFSAKKIATTRNYLYGSSFKFNRYYKSRIFNSYN